jgi:hypothetical protein
MRVAAAVGAGFAGAASDHMRCAWARMGAGSSRICHEAAVLNHTVRRVAEGPK